MKRYDKELFLRCDCGEPFHSVFFGYDKEGIYHEGGELMIQFHAYYGSFWQRVKAAVKLIFSGRQEKDPDYVFIGGEYLQDLMEFCRACLEMAKKENGGDNV